MGSSPTRPTNIDIMKPYKLIPVKKRRGRVKGQLKRMIFTNKSSFLNVMFFQDMQKEKSLYKFVP